jgi:hypothetical protein
MSLLVIDFNYLLGQESEVVVKELAVVDYSNDRFSSYIFKKPYDWEEVPMFLRRLNSVANHGCNWDDGDILYTELENVLLRETSSAIAIYCFGSLKADFIERVTGRTVIDITQLGCPEISALSYPSYTCTFPCHNKAKSDCALRSAYSVAQWLTFNRVSHEYKKCPSQPECH